jgi:SAM-dependent methyltransferase
VQIPYDRRVRRAQTFNEIAELYDQGRREPPDWLYEELFSSSGLDPALAKILEIGCGTGKSTLPLARRGCHVVALEMGANLTRLARQHLAGFPHVQVLNTRFEDWAAVEAFDLVLAITAWHWLDPAVRYQRAAAALKPGGVLAFARSEHAFPPGYDPFFEQVQDCYEAVGVGRLAWPPRPPEAIGDQRVEIERTGLFDDVRVIRRLWAEEFTADEHVALMRTASDHQLMEPEKRERLFAASRCLIDARPEGRILKHNLTLLHLARKRPRQPVHAP